MHPMKSGTIIYNKSVTLDALRMGIAVDDSFHAKPGQFIMIRCSSSMEPLLRRPFSILSVREFDSVRVFEILYKIVGTGTQRLAERKEGEIADYLGPLGQGFLIIPDKELWLVGGGIGIPPLYFLAEELKKMDTTIPEVQIFFGSRTFEELYCLKGLEKLGYPLHITTDDSSYGEPGFVSNPLVRMIEEYGSNNRPLPVIYACGPEGLLRVLSRMAELYDIEIQMSMEMRMGCGVGICQGCAVKIKEENSGFDYKSACIEGPVFDAKKIIWL